MTDEQLLSQFCKDRSEAAFTELVERHLGWVRGVAARGLGEDSSCVDDVSQAVFIALAKKAGSLNGRSRVAGWLFRATRYTVSHVRRTEKRRKKHEQEVPPVPDQSTQPQWLLFAPLLDELVAGLSELDRRAVLARFYGQKTFTEVGNEIGVSEEAARARVNRALERLRTMFARRGVTAPSVAALSSLIAEHVLLPASKAQAASVVMAACGRGSTSAAQSMAEQPLRALSPARLMPVALTLTVLAIATVLVILAHFHGQSRLAPAVPQSPTLANNALPMAVPRPTLARETDVPGDTQLARWDVMLTPEGGDAVAAVCEPIETQSKMYFGMTANADALRQAVAAAELAGQVASIPEIMRLDGHYSDGETKPIDGLLPIDFMYSMTAKLAMLQSLSPASEAATPVDSNHLHLVMSHGPTDSLIIVEGGPGNRNNDQRWVLGAKVEYDGVLEAGQAVAFMASIAAPSGKVYSHLIVWETFKSTAKQFWKISNQRDPRFWIHTGPSKMRDWIDAAQAWSANAPDAVKITDTKFSHTLSDGKIVHVAALARFDQRPFCWWNPSDGKPVAFDGYFEMHGSPTDGLVIAVTQTAAEAISHREQPPCVPNQWFEGYLPRVIGAEDTAVDVGVSVGEWRAVADIKPGETVRLGQATYHLDKNADDWQRTGEVEDQEEVFSAVGPDGKEQCQSMAQPIVIRRQGETLPRKTNGKLALPRRFVAMGRLWYRKREWVRFEGFKNEPFASKGDRSAEQPAPLESR